MQLREKKMGEKPIHVVMFPWCAFGHMIPFLKLSITLAKAGVIVSFISTPRNIQRLPKPPSHLSHLLQMVEVPLPSLDPPDLLPEGAEASVDVPAEKLNILKDACYLMKHPVKQLVAKWKPDWIIYDIRECWVAEIAQEFHIKLLFFSALPALALVFIGPPGPRKAILTLEDLTSPPEWVPFPSSVAFKRHEAIGFVAATAKDKADDDDAAAAGRSRKKDGFLETVAPSDAVLVRSCYEIEGEYLKLYPELIGKPVIPIGLLPTERVEKRKEVDVVGGESWVKIFEWLGKQAPKSVVFVGFGSECKLSKDQVFEIAYGLEVSDLPFLWALRKPNWAISDDDSLPVGFAERVSNRGIVCMGWAPQEEILAHPSIGGFLFHSGWGSMIEALQYGHTLVVLPFVFDQPLDARFMVEKDLAIEVERDEDGLFSRHDIAEALRKAMVLEEGEKVRIKTSDAAKVVGDFKLHQDYMAAFVKFLKTGIWKQK